jgi:hypothetical protein
MTIESLLPRLKGVRRSGNGYVALCPSHNDRHPSLSITQRGDHLLLHCFRDCVIEIICEALGIRVGDLFGSTGTQSNTRWTGPERRAYARDIWRASRPPAGTIVEVYLRNRGISMPLPTALRFIPLLEHREYGYGFPALAVGLQDVSGKFAAVSVTWLCADGSDKAPADPQRKVYGPYQGSAVRLRPAGEMLVICEGVETGLSIAQACPALPVWCALSATNLPHVVLPQSVRDVIIAADADVGGEQAAVVVAQRFIHEGRAARIARPAQPGTDFNDLRL